MISVKTIGAAALGAAAIGLGCAVTPAEAATLDFNFSFTNDATTGGGTVTGIVRGLTDNATSAATSVEVLTNTSSLGSFGIGEYIGNPTVNSFTLSSGVITSAGFTSVGVLNTSPAVTDSSLGFFFNFPNAPRGAGLAKNRGGFNLNPNAGLTFTPATPVPTPALLPGLIGLGAAALRKRKQEKVEAEV